MHLVLHAGLHKTGTTTFQNIVTALQANLLERDVYVPVADGTANMGYHIVHPAQRGDWSGYDDVLDDAQAALTPDGILLVSAEDLENCLFDIEFGRHFMARAMAKGVASIRWVFVQRNAFEYFESLYGELSRHQQVLQYDLMADEILARGVFSCATPRFRWYFMFHYTNAVERFRKLVCADAIGMSFSEFTRDAVGAAVFRLFGREADYSSLHAQVHVEPQNVRLSPEEIERRYVATFLRSGEYGAASAERLQPEEAIVDSLVARRLDVRSQCRPAIMRRFERELGGLARTEGG
ncbi:MAG: hypothetical protein ACKOOF_04750 [Planctomycetaceae bacterium]